MTMRQRVTLMLELRRLWRVHGAPMSPDGLVPLDFVNRADVRAILAALDTGDLCPITSCVIECARGGYWTNA